MTRIRRYFKAGQICALTHVTYNRAPILVEHFDLLRIAVESAKGQYPFNIIAWVVLPDHAHIVLDPMKSDIPKLMRKIKLAFSKNYRIKAGMKSGRVWQNRYWDHIIRDQNDFNRHVDYIHYNPVKHNLALNALDYEYSSLSEFMKNGLYPPNWGKKDTLTFDGDFGE